MKIQEKFKNQFYQKIFFLFFILFLGILALLFENKYYYSGKGELIFFDVGEGDSIFIKTPQNFTILIDGGPSKKIIYDFSEVLPFWNRKIDLVVLTHPHSDHLLGLNEVLKYYKVGEFWFTGVLTDDPNYHQLINLIKEKNIPTKIIKMGDFKKFKDGSYLEILWPQDSIYQRKVNDLNFYSVVCRFRFGKNQFLFLADINDKVEKEILKKFNLDVQLFKVLHHGADDSILEDFVAKIHPDYALISVGKNNKFGHPSSKTLSLLEKYNVKILRTDQLGKIVFIFNNQGIEKEFNKSTFLTNIFLFIKIIKEWKKLIYLTLLAT